MSRFKPIITAKNSPTKYWGLLIWQIIGCLDMFATTARYIFEIDNFVTYIFDLLSNYANVSQLYLVTERMTFQNISYET